MEALFLANRSRSPLRIGSRSSWRNNRVHVIQSARTFGRFVRYLTALLPALIKLFRRFDTVSHSIDPDQKNSGLRPLLFLVEHTGFEPVTSTLPVWRASNCANTPNICAASAVVCYHTTFVLILQVFFENFFNFFKMPTFSLPPLAKTPTRIYLKSADSAQSAALYFAA